MNIGLQPDIPMKVGSSANFQNTKLNDSIERKTFKSCAAFYCNYSCISPPPERPWSLPTGISLPQCANVPLMRVAPEEMAPHSARMASYCGEF